MARYLLRRLAFAIPQVALIATVMFVLLRVIPADPAVLIAGPAANAESVATIRADLGLDGSILEQYWEFIKQTATGDLGRSWVTGNPVTKDLRERFPATLELLTYSLLVAVVAGVCLGVVTARRADGFGGKVAERGTFVFSLLAGAMPEFWIGLMVVYVFFYRLEWLPAPLGRLDPGVAAPTNITGFYTVDSLVTGNWAALKSSVTHLIGPVFVLAFVITGPILKMTRFTMAEVLESDYIRRSRANGLPARRIQRIALRNALPPVVTLVAILYGYLIGGAVLVETVFSWGGMGQYAVQSINSADFAPLQGFVIVVTLFSLFVYLLVDILYTLLDPRIRL